MNFRVFLLIGAVVAFGALRSSDGRYQTQQIEMARVERARATNESAAFVAKLKSEVDRFASKLAIKVGEVARAKAAEAMAATPVPATRIVIRTNSVTTPQALFGRLVIAWVFNVDPGIGVSVVTRQATLAKSQFEERYCLLRFQTRQAAFTASRRLTTFLRDRLSSAQPPGRMARVIIREIEATQAPAAGDRRLQ